MKKYNRISLVVSAISFLALIIFLSLLLADKFHIDSCGCPKVVSRNFIYLFIGLASLFIASLFYYLLSFKIDSQKKIINKNMDLLYSLLDSNEKKIFDIIVKSNGCVYQRDLNKTFGKLKSYRIIQKLKDKNIIIIVKENNINRIELKKGLRDALKNEI